MIALTLTQTVTEIWFKGGLTCSMVVMDDKGPSLSIDRQTESATDDSVMLLNRWAQIMGHP